MAGGDKKKKKKRSERSRSRSPQRRERSPKNRDSSRDSSPSDSDSDRRGRRDKDRPKNRKNEKDYYKSLETAEEKRARRLGKKEAKEKKRRQQMGWNNEYEGYTNTDNPFGDAHLLETFVWHKKREKHGEADLSEDDKRMTDKKRQMETRKQLERVRHRRAEREREMVLREEEKEKMQRDKESTYYSAWEKQEDTFHLEQAMLRSKIRIQDGRAKPIDLLAQYISTEADEDLDIKMHEPYMLLVGLTQGDLSDLLEDIKVYMELEQNKNTEYWQDITTICKDEIQKLKKQYHEDQLSRREGIHEAVHSDVAGIFTGKTHSQLIALEKQIYSKISSGDAVDIGYWESLLQQLKVFMAKARLKERHQKMLREKLLQLKEKKTETTDSTGEIDLSDSESEPEKPEEKSPETVEQSPQEEKSRNDDEQQPSTSKSWRDESDEDEDKTEGNKVEEKTISIFTEEDLLEECYAAFKAGNYGPKLIKTADVEQNLILDPEEDWQKLIALREDIKSGGTHLVKVLESSSMEREEANRGLGPDEETFNVPHTLSQKTYSWEDKYRPRKPRFFNRVHTGYEWNKYNQTHYDSDNPPPKIVQGYKFNIFYPDLIDKTVAPEYYVDPEKDAQDFAILRFHAGSPYEDIAFKIVNREWEYSHRKGFRCQFHNNIFQLWFHFKRYRYRR